MDVKGHTAEANPLQDRVLDSMRVEYTTVNMPKPPKDHVIWSLLSLLHWNPFCLGLAALISSIKARDRMMVGDLEGAQRHGATARCLNIWATVMSILTVVTLIILYFYGPGLMPIISHIYVNLFI